MYHWDDHPMQWRCCCQVPCRRLSWLHSPLLLLIRSWVDDMMSSLVVSHHQEVESMLLQLWLPLLEWKFSDQSCSDLAVALLQLRCTWLMEDSWSGSCRVMLRSWSWLCRIHSVENCSQCGLGNLEQRQYWLSLSEMDCISESIIKVTFSTIQSKIQRSTQKKFNFDVGSETVL